MDKFSYWIRFATAEYDFQWSGWIEITRERYLLGALNDDQQVKRTDKITGEIA